MTARQTAIFEKRCLAGGPDAVFSCSMAIIDLAGGGYGSPPESAPLRTPATRRKKYSVMGGYGWSTRST